MKSLYYIAFYLIAFSCTLKPLRPVGRNYNNDNIYFRAEMARFEFSKFRKTAYHTVIYFENKQQFHIYSDSIIWIDSKHETRILQPDNGITYYGDSIKNFQFIEGEWKQVNKR